jgi:hypothetical protein
MRRVVNTGQTKRYGNKKVEIDGIIFDSIWEGEMYKFLRSTGLEFEVQKRYILISGVPKRGNAGWLLFEKEGARQVTLKVDFEFELKGITYILDTKGVFNKYSRLKYTLLKHYLIKQKRAHNTKIVILKKKEFSGWAWRLKLIMEGKLKEVL